jgi:monooxygenase
VDLSKTITHKGMMHSDVPNLASAFGYTNASWTLKRDFTVEYVCRLLEPMDQHSLRAVHLTRERPELTAVPTIDFKFRLHAAGAPHLAATGIENAMAHTENYVKNFSMLRFGRVESLAISTGRRDTIQA